jgi:hypothetical protein
MASQNFLEFPGKSPPHYHVESTWHLITHSIWHGFYHLCDRSLGLIPWPILVVVDISYPWFILTILRLPTKIHQRASF